MGLSLLSTKRIFQVCADPPAPPGAIGEQVEPWGPGLSCLSPVTLNESGLRCYLLFGSLS